MIRYDDDEVEKIDKESLTGKVQGEYSAGNLSSWCKPSDIHCNGDEDEDEDVGDDSDDYGDSDDGRGAGDDVCHGGDESEDGGANEIKILL